MVLYEIPELDHITLYIAIQDPYRAARDGDFFCAAANNVIVIDHPPHNIDTLSMIDEQGNELELSVPTSENVSEGLEETSCL